MTPNVVSKMLLELRGDAAVAAIVGTRVRVFEPKARTYDSSGNLTDAGDARAPGHYVAFIVLVTIDTPIPRPRAPVQRAVIECRCYGRTPIEASDLRWAASNAIHLRGGRTHTNGLHIYQSLDESGGEQEKDPDTQQPYQSFIVTAHASTLAVA